MIRLHGMQTADMGPVSIYALHGDTPQQGGGLVVVSGDIRTFADLEEEVEIRVQSSCELGEVIGTLDCDCGAQLAAAKRRTRAGRAFMLFYLRQEGRGAGPEAKLEAMALQQREGIDTYAAYDALGLPRDQRDYRLVPWFLREHRIGRVGLRSNNPAKRRGIEAGGVEVVQRRWVFGVTPTNIPYLRAKRDKGSHDLPEDLDSYLLLDDNAE